MSHLPTNGQASYPIFFLLVTTYIKCKAHVYQSLWFALIKLMYLELLSIAEKQTFLQMKWMARGPHQVVTAMKTSRCNERRCSCICGVALFGEGLVLRQRRPVGEHPRVLGINTTSMRIHNGLPRVPPCLADLAITRYSHHHSQTREVIRAWTWLSLSHDIRRNECTALPKLSR